MLEARLDSDHIPDRAVIVNEVGASRIAIRLSASESLVLRASGVNLSALSAVDIDYDGDVDLIAGGVSRAFVWLNNGRGGFTELRPTPGTRFQGVPVIGVRGGQLPLAGYSVRTLALVAKLEPGLCVRPGRAPPLAGWASSSANHLPSVPARAPPFCTSLT